MQAKLSWDEECRVSSATPFVSIQLVPVREAWQRKADLAGLSAWMWTAGRLDVVALLPGQLDSVCGGVS